MGTLLKMLNIIKKNLRNFGFFGLINMVHYVEITKGKVAFIVAFDALFSPITIKGLTLKNRVIMPAMKTSFCTENGEITQQLIDYHVARAKGGCGLNITECCAVHESTHGINYMALYKPVHKNGLKALADALHKAGGKLCVQLWHGGNVIKRHLPEDVTPMTPENMTKEDIDTIVAAFGNAAAMAVEAGVDCIEFQAAHGFLPHAFLSTAYNKRTDEYNGSFENRARFAFECIEAIRKNMPEDMPLLMRVNAQDDHPRGGMSINDTIEFIKAAKEKGVDMADVSRGNPDSEGIKYEVPSFDVPKGFNIDNAAIIRASVDMPVAVAGRINRPKLANNAIAEGKVDMVAVGRGQLADPDFCNKVQAGDIDRIRYCIGCNQGCFDGINDPKIGRISCLRNPFIGKEGSDRSSEALGQRKRVLIAGAGIAGLVAANILVHRGHIPVIYEASNQLGGQLILAGRAPTKTEMEEAAVWEGEEVKRLGVEIHLNTPVTTELIEQMNPDAVIIAIGAAPRRIPMPGMDLPNVFVAHDVLAGKATPKGKVAILGGGLVGIEVAEYLTLRGAECIVLSRSMQMGGNLGKIRKLFVAEQLQEMGIQCIVNASGKEITPTEVLYEQDGFLKALECDNVVIAMGSKARPSEDLQDKCKEMDIPCFVVGDAANAGLALLSSAQGAEAAMKI